MKTNSFTFHRTCAKSVHSAGLSFQASAETPITPAWRCRNSRASVSSAARGSRKCLLVHLSNSRFGSRITVAQYPLSPDLGLLFYERIVHQDQRLGGHVGNIATPCGLRGNGNVEGQHHRRQKIAADRDVDATATVTVERPGLRPPPASHERCQIYGDWRALQRSIQSARHGEDRITYNFAPRVFALACGATKRCSDLDVRPTHRVVGWTSDRCGSIPVRGSDL